MKNFAPEQQPTGREGRLMKLVDEMSSVTVTDSPSFRQIIRRKPTEATRKVC